MRSARIFARYGPLQNCEIVLFRANARISAALNADSSESDASYGPRRKKARQQAVDFKSVRRVSILLS